MTDDNLADLAAARRAKNGGNDGGGGYNKLDDRLRGVEVGLGKLETKIEHLATKENIEAMKTSFWRGTLAAVGVVASLTLVVSKLF